MLNYNSQWQHFYSSGLDITMVELNKEKRDCFHTLYQGQFPVFVKGNLKIASLV